MTPSPVKDGVGNIDQIRDIIFGAQLREFNQRFDKLETNALKLHEEARKAIEEVRNTLAAELRGTVELLERKFQTHVSNAEVAASAARQKIEATESKVDEALRSLAAETGAARKAVQDEVTQAREALSAELQAMKSQLVEAVNARVAELLATKVSRSEIAELLLEMGGRLKQTG